MKEILSLAQTRDEYSLIVGLMACCAASGADMNVEIHKAEVSEMISGHLSAYRSLPRSVDSYIEECPTGPNLNSPSSAP